MGFAEHLVSLRRARGWSQEQLADYVGVSRQAVSKWESGRSTPDLDKLLTLSSLFGIPLDALVRGEESAIAEAGPASDPGNGADVPQGERVVYVVRDDHWEYKSKRTLFGMPLVHINCGRGLRVARGIVAVGNLSLGGVSVGCLSAGLFSFGAFSLGLLLSIGAISVDCISLGALAVGGVALGACALGVYAAGAAAAASSVAVGAAASAPVAVGVEARGLHALSGADQLTREEILAFLAQWAPGLWKPLRDLLTLFLS